LVRSAQEGIIFLKTTENSLSFGCTNIQSGGPKADPEKSPQELIFFAYRNKANSGLLFSNHQMIKIYIHSSAQNKMVWRAKGMDETNSIYFATKRGV
jgi:hypothetical protein